MASIPEQPAGDIEEAVERALWEPLHEWESRVKFVEDNAARYGLEKAVQLSIVWGNMQFLGCKYPGQTEALVSYYPQPTPDELRERRKRRPAKISPQDSADGPPDPKKPTRQEVSDLISSIRSQAEHDSTATFGLVESIARKICLCERCIGKTDNVAIKAQQILEKHTALCSEPVEMTFKDSTDGDVCTLAYRGEMVVEKTASDKKNAKSAVCAELMKSVVEWQEANQFPPCRHEAPPSSYPSNPPPSQPYSSYPTNSYQQPRYPPPSHNYPSQARDPRGYQSQSRDQGRDYSRQSHDYPPQSRDYQAPRDYSQRNYAPQTRYPSPYDTSTNSYPPPKSYTPRPQGGNYYMPPQPRGGGNHGYRGGYNRGGYYGK